MSLDPLRIIFSGGGTGGHLFPAIALSRAFIREFQGTELLFITTGNPLEDRLICENGFRREMISIKGLKGKNIVDQVKNLLRLPKAVLDSMKILRAFGPQLVMGLGGYSSGPVVLAGRLLGLKTAICEQNILPGITNRLLSHLAHRVFVSFPDTIGNFDPAKVRIFGNPVREEIVDAFERQRCGSVSPPFQNRPFTVAILGGSQGAHGINLAVRDALSNLRDKDRFFFIHQSGGDDEALVRAAYQSAGVDADVRAFFKHMGDVYQKADLIVCRAGATTVAEICVSGKPAVYIPYPFAADNHQELNAKSMAARNAAEMILQRDLTGKALAETIMRLADNPEKLAVMGTRARETGKPDAAKLIAHECYRLVLNR